jgi:hypothetical protein
MVVFGVKKAKTKVNKFGRTLHPHYTLLLLSFYEKKSVLKSFILIIISRMVQGKNVKVPQ